MSMKAWKRVDLFAFIVTLIAGMAAALGGGLEWKVTTMVAGCIAVVAPIVNRIAATREQRMLRQQLGPRTLSEKQRKILIESLRKGPPFTVTVAHNRLEAEQVQLYQQLSSALTEAGLATSYWGGLNNATSGIEISGDERSPEKARLKAAFAAAGIPFLSIVLTDDPENKRGIEVFIGVNPGPSME